MRHSFMDRAEREALSRAAASITTDRTAAALGRVQAAPTESKPNA